MWQGKFRYFRKNSELLGIPIFSLSSQRISVKIPLFLTTFFNIWAPYF